MTEPVSDLQILVVEDDHALRDVVARALREEGYTVVTAVDGSSALRTATAGAFDLAVLDIGLPDSDGRDVCQALRAYGFTAPVLFLTARGELSDRLTGFAAGGDDYLTKPFHVAELLARLRALGKRRPDAVPPVTDTGVRLDPAEHALVSPSGRCELTPTEYRLLGCLMARPRSVVRRRDLRQAGWPDGSQVTDNSLDQSIARLRRKLAVVDPGRTIETARGIGYRFS